jgi:hypothetical protein
MSAKRVPIVFTTTLSGLLLAAMPAASQEGPPVSQATYPVQLTSPVSGRSLPPQAHPPGPREIPMFHPPVRPHSGNAADPVVQASTPTPSAAQALGQWEGLGAGYPGFTVGAVPPDPNMAVGPNHIVQWVNNNFVIFGKQGNQVQAPVADSTFWGAGSTCYQGGGFSDPIIKYDRAADRWIVGEVAIPLLSGFFGQYAQCFAVSKTSDPTYTSDANGNNTSYNIWAYGFGANVNDYDKIAVWSDGYYVTWNIFLNGSTFNGAETCAWNRTDMLNGVAAPRFQCFQLSTVYASLLAADWDGATAPPAGSPEYFMDIDPSSGALNLWNFHFDSTTPNNSTFTGPTSISGVAAFTAPCPNTQDCIPQPGTTQNLDAIGDRLMYRVGYRNFGDHESLVANHTVVAGAGNTGVRWYEVRSPNGTPTIYQQGTFAPDSDNRWMSSIAMDQAGNIGVGYSVASAATYPSIRYTGWQVGNTLGTLQAETSLVAGGGSQTAYNRWGDYSLMQTDPGDDCTFWYTQEYYATTQTADWNTRIGSFKFSNCGQALRPTTTTLVSSANPSVYGQPVTFTATVAGTGGTPTGNVTFKDGSTTLGSAPLNSSGVAMYTTPSLTDAAHSMTAVYGGDAAFAGSTSSALSQNVNQAGTTTALGSSLNPSTYGTSVTFTATVTAVAPGAGTPTGTVTFKDGNTTIGSSAINGSGTATFSTSSLATASHSITAVYSGDTNFTTSTSTVLTQTVNKANTSTALNSSPNPSTYGQSVTFTATVTPSTGTGSPTGSVTFTVDGTAQGPVGMSGGSASFSTANLSAGSHSITASYNGDSNYSTSSSGTVTQTVNKAGTTTTLNSSANPSTTAQSVTFTATVSAPAATGTVTFYDGVTVLGSGNLTSGKATFTTSSLTAGSHSISASYGGDTNYSSSNSSTLTQVVNSNLITTTTSLVSSLNPSNYGQSVTLTATVSPTTGSGTPTGRVTFMVDGAAQAPLALSGGKAALVTSSLTAGSHSISASYGGDSNYTGSTSSTLTQTVNKTNTTTTLTGSPNPSNNGQTVTFTATVSPAGTGTVHFFNGGTPIGTVNVSSGKATLQISTLPVGTDSIKATYSGDTNYNSSTSVIWSQTVRHKK